jgi:VWFA-related protein
MTSRSGAVPAVAASIAAFFWSGPLGAERAAAPQQTPPIFRSTTDVVMVDVAVRTGGRMVTGLKAADFDLRDNGVRQRVETVESAAVPIDLTLVIDVSGNHQGPVEPRLDLVAAARQPAEDIERAAALLRADDRLRVLTIDTYGRQVIAPRPPLPLPELRLAAAGGMASLYDTLIAALLLPVEPERRHVIIASTKGVDSVSAMDAETVRDIAQRADALVHLVADESMFLKEMDLAGLQRGNAQYPGFMLRLPIKRFWKPETSRALQRMPQMGTNLTLSGQALAEAALVTGGALHRGEMLSEPTLVGTFKKAFEDFRQSYVLRYTPQNVKREGWHEIKVTVPSHPKAVIRARRGYAINPVEPVRAGGAGASVPNVAPLRLPSAAADVVAAYDRGEHARVEGSLVRMADPTDLIRDFRNAGNPWPATPKREAALVLELAEAGLFSRDGEARTEARDLLETFTRLIRHPLEPDAFERTWHWTTLSIVQGTLRPDLAEPFVRRALERFPEEPRFVLARAIVADQRWHQQLLSGGAGGSEAVLPKIEAAVANPETAGEARVRLGWALHRAGRFNDALARLDEVADARSPDITMRYLRQLFRGHTLDALGRKGDAIDAYRAALVVVPGAQSARIALMNLHLRRGDRAEALALAESVQTAPATQPDPFWSYWQADFRFYPALIARVREMVR